MTHLFPVLFDGPASIFFLHNPALFRSGTCPTCRHPAATVGTLCVIDDLFEIRAGWVSSGGGVG